MTGAGAESSRLMKEWFELMRERSELRRYERELLVRRQEMELEDRHARLQHELRLSLAKDGGLLLFMILHTFTHR